MKEDQRFPAGTIRRWKKAAARPGSVFSKNLFAVFLLTACASSFHAAETDSFDPGNPETWDIKRLMDTKISIIGPSETVAKTPAAVSVVTQDDIRRSGAMNIPEALRLVPGLEVAQLDASQWAVSARGFNDVYANKLLVMQDGRSIYTPLFSGVFWDVQGTLMEDIERIEVVRGPGATLWGANAVNGVINIITASAKDTQGTLITGGGGTQQRGFAGARYGGKFGDGAYFRIYGTYFNHDNSALPNGDEAWDSWQLARAGLRTDWDLSDQNLLTVQGDAYAGWFRELYNTFDPFNPPTFSRPVRDEFAVHGGNVLGRWTHSFSESSDLKVQLYYDRTERDVVLFNETRDTFDVNLQHEFDLGNRNHIVWGAGYRVTSDREENNPTLSFTPTRRTANLFSTFVQDEIALVRDDRDENRLSLTLGSKFEHNDYTGFEIQPGARLLWAPWERHAFWASVARAVRTPSRAEDDIALTQPTPLGPTTVYGSRQFQAEELTAYELGYRSLPFERASFDLAVFYNVYDNLRSIETNTSPTQPPSLPTFPLHVDNRLYGETYGAEISAAWEVTDWWRLRPAYTYLQMELHTRRNSTDTTSEQDEGKSPHHQVSLRSSMNLPHHVSFDITFRYVDSLPAIRVPSYVTFDARLAWRVNPHLEISVVGQNLVESHHPEFRPSFIGTQAADVPRSVYGKITWRF